MATAQISKMKNDGAFLCYSSLPNDAHRAGTAKRKEPQPFASPLKTFAVNSARKFRDRAHSLASRKVPSTQSGDKIPGMDEVTPVLHHEDDDAIKKRDRDDVTTFLDPFSFEGSAGPTDAFYSPTSLVPVRLFPDDASNSNVFMRKEGNGIFGNGKLDSFDSPIFTGDFKCSEEESSIDINKITKTANNPRKTCSRDSIQAKKTDASECLDASQDSKLLWDGFKRSASFTVCEWDERADAGILTGCLALPDASRASDDDLFADAGKISRAKKHGGASTSTTGREELISEIVVPAVGSPDLHAAIAVHESAFSQEVNAIKALNEGIENIQSKFDDQDNRDMEDLDMGA